MKKISDSFNLGIGYGVVFSGILILVSVAVLLLLHNTSPTTPVAFYLIAIGLEGFILLFSGAIATILIHKRRTIHKQD
ncbi:MAG: hypothetical protein ACFFC6_12730 [Promethearchaeota archaeon]